MWLAHGAWHKNCCGHKLLTVGHGTCCRVQRTVVANRFEDATFMVGHGTCCLVQLTQLWSTDFAMRLHACRPAMGLGDFCIAGMAPMCTSMFAVLLWALERFCTCCQPSGVRKTTKLAHMVRGDDPEFSLTTRTQRPTVQWVLGFNPMTGDDGGPSSQCFHLVVGSTPHTVANPTMQWVLGLNP